MHRQPLRDQLAIYRCAHPAEAATLDRVESLIAAHEDCLLRSCLPGHITASVWIVDPSRQRFLLTHHRKLKRWLQLGGHVDGESAIERAALREAQEESGITGFDLVQPQGRPLVIDVDVHTIPAHGDEPPHEHHDIRFLLIAHNDALRLSAESLALRWFHRKELPQLTADQSILRLAQKSHTILDHSQRPPNFGHPSS